MAIKKSQDQSMEPIKNNREQRKSNKFITCFKPIDMDAEETDVCIGSVKKTASLTNSWNHDSTVFVCNVDSGEVDIDDSKDSMKMTKIKFSLIAKAVLLFESSLKKTMQKKKSKENLFRSNSNISTNSDRSISPAVSSLSSSSSHKELNKAIVTKPTTSSSVSKAKLGRSRSLSIGLSTKNNKLLPRKNNVFRSNSMDRIKAKQQRDGNDWNYGLCLLLVSLFVMVVWGKACAILCTSTWIFIVRHRSVGHSSSPESRVVVPKLDSVEYKKRIIMEGLLERNRSRVL